MPGSRDRRFEGSRDRVPVVVVVVVEGREEMVGGGRCVAGRW